MEALTFNNNFGLYSNLSEPINFWSVSIFGYTHCSVFIMKIADIDNYRNSKLSNGKIRVRIERLFNQVRTQVRTKIMALMLVSSSKVSTQVSTEKAPIKHRVNNGVIMVKFLIIQMVLCRLDFIKIHNSYRKNQAVQKVKSFLLAGNKLDTGIQLINAVLVDTKVDTNLNVRSKFAPKTNLLMRTYLIIQHVRREFCETIKKGNYLLGLANFSRQTAITQAEKFVPSFFICSSICSIKSRGKRISFRLDLLVSLAIFMIRILLVRTIYTKLKNKNSIDMCGQNKIYCADRLILKILIKSIAQRVRTSMDYLTANIKDTNAMANSNNTLHPKNGQQSKLFKFFDFSTAQVVQTTATTEQQARKNLGEQSLIFIARKPINTVFNHVNNWGCAHA